MKILYKMAFILMIFLLTAGIIYAEEQDPADKTVKKTEDSAKNDAALKDKKINNDSTGNTPSGEIDNNTEVNTPEKQDNINNNDAKDEKEDPGNKKVPPVITDNTLKDSMENKNNGEKDLEKNVVPVVKENPVKENGTETGEDLKNDTPEEKADLTDKKDIVNSNTDSPSENNIEQKSGHGILNMLRGNSYYIGFGRFSPIADYGEYYNGSYLFSARASLLKINYLGFFPEAAFRYSSFDSKTRSDRYNSTMSLTQIIPGIAYRYETKLPGFISSRSGLLSNPVILYGRAADGITRVSYESQGSGGVIVEYINTFEMGAGFIYQFKGNFEAGMDLGYSRVFTAGENLQGITAMLVLGYRI